MFNTQPKARQAVQQVLYDTASLTNNYLVDCLTVGYGQTYNIPAQQEKENNMYAQQEDSKNYILRRIRDLYSEKRDAIWNHFYGNLPAPSSVKEAREWLKKGEFRFDIPDYLNDETQLDPKNYFRWGKTGPDEKAYDAAQKALQADKQSAIDTVSVRTDEEIRLRTLRDFESKTYH